MSSCRCGRERRQPGRKAHAHFVGHDALFLVGGRLVGDGDVKVAVIPRVGRTGKAAGDLVALVDRHGGGGVEHGLSGKGTSAAGRGVGGERY